MNAAPATTSVRVYRSIDQIPAETLQLFAAAEQHYPEFAAGWFANLQQTVYPDDPGVRYYVAERAGRPVAILPVRLARYGMVRRVEALGNFYTSLYSPILNDEATAIDLAALLQAASRDHGGAHEMRFAPMDPAAPAYAATLAALRNIGWIPFRYFCFGNWHLAVDSDWKTHLERRSGELRSTLKRKGKKFAAAGGTLEIITDPAQAEAAIADFNHVYARSWKKPEPYPDFIPGLIRWLAERGWLRLGIAKLEGQPIAAQLWMTSHGRANIFKLAHDEAFAEHAAGTLLTARLMEQAIDRDHSTDVDYLIGEDTYKQLWMSQRRERWGCTAYNPRSFVGLTLMLQEIVGRTFRSFATPTPKQPSPEAMKWTILPIARFKDHAAHWDKLARRVAPVPFLESMFLEPALREFGNGNEKLAYLATGEHWHAAAIVGQKRFGIWETFQASQLPLGAWVADNKFTLQQLTHSLTRSLPGFCAVLNITQQDPLFQARPADDPTLSTLDYIDTAWIDIDQTFDDYWNARGKNLRANVRKQHNKLQADGIDARLECITHPEHVAQAIEEYGRLESTGWKGKDGTAVHPGNAQGRFYRQMLENFCKAGRGRIYRYSFDGNAVAMDLCIETEGTIVILKTAYDETFKAVSPGTLMRYDEFGELYKGGKLKRIEFYGKVMEWHTRWTDNKRALHHTTKYRWKLLARGHKNYSMIKRISVKHDFGGTNA
jgi:CelD/BcsL family acetyltransferase involved in cellulose biosynthesis